MRRTLTSVLVLASLCACGSSSPCRAPTPKVEVRGSSGPVVLYVEVARTLAEQQRGLGGRSSLGPDDGMAFVFEGPTTDAFWMKDTTIPLSVAFWDGSGRIVDLFDMSPCASAPCHRYRSSRPYVGAVEANRGYFSRHGIAVGDRIRLDAPACR